MAVPLGPKTASDGSPAGKKVPEDFLQKYPRLGML